MASAPESLTASEQECGATAVAAPPKKQKRDKPAGRKRFAKTKKNLTPEEIRAERDAFIVDRKSCGVDWPTAIWIAAIHVGVLAAPFTFTWQGLVLMLFMGWLTGSIGICLGFHRFLTHRSFKTSKPMRWLIAWIGGLAGEGSAIHWVANHRKHHAHSDEPGDPHSPHDGSWWSHMIWFMWKFAPGGYDAHNNRWAPDVAKDPVMRFLDKTFVLWHVVTGFVFFGLGYWLGGESMAWSFVVWGMFVRLVYVLHSTWFVNSASHMWGYRTYETTDDSRNNWWVALLTYGEGWHNNHHAFPSMARAGHKWWELDITFWAIRALEKCGLIWDVVDGHHKRKTRYNILKTEGKPVR
jgi:stearoyl-CoA desaturase (delta-9 desaturase)